MGKNDDFVWVLDCTPSLGNRGCKSRSLRIRIEFYLWNEEKGDRILICSGWRRGWVSMKELVVIWKRAIPMDDDRVCQAIRGRPPRTFAKNCLGENGVDTQDGYGCALETVSWKVKVGG